MTDLLGKLQRLGELLDPGTLTGAAIFFVLFAAGAIVLSWLIRRMFREILLHDRSERVDQITIQFVSHLSVLAVWLIMATFYAHLVPALNRVSTALLAGVSLASVVIGFAAQETLGNLVAGVGLVLYKPFRRGDRLQIPAPTEPGFEVGTVEDVSLGYTLLKTDDGREIIIANSTMVQETMIKLAKAPTTDG